MWPFEILGLRSEPASAGSNEQLLSLDYALHPADSHVLRGLVCFGWTLSWPFSRLFNVEFADVLVVSS